MKKLFIGIIGICLLTISANAQTEGILTVSTSTSDAGGNYSPKNIVAIWVEDNSGNFVKTLLAYANTRITHLNTWEDASDFNVVDAITGATKTSHAVRTCSWNGTDISGNIVSDGVYKVWMELTDKNSTGNFSSFTFTKGNSEENLTPSNVPSFSSITIDWVPSGSAAVVELDPNNYQMYPNPVSEILKIKGEGIISVDITNIFGDVLLSSEYDQISIAELASGVYFVNIHTEKGIILKKLLKE